MIGPTPTRIRTLRYTGASVICHRCEVCGSKDAPYGYNGRWFCASHRTYGELELKCPHV